MLHVFDMAGKEVGEIDLSDAVFGIEPNSVGNACRGGQLPGQPAPGHPVHPDPYRSQQAAAANPGDRKAPATQDRAPSELPSGDTAASLWARNPVITATSLNKKVKRLAMKSALSSKVQDGDMIVLDNMQRGRVQDQDDCRICSKLWALTKKR